MLKNNKDITIYGDGTQTRSFCYIEDMINGIISMINSSETGSILGMIVNILLLI